MSIQQTEAYRKLNLNKQDRKIFEAMLLKAREAFELCKNTPNQKPLTKDEYEQAHLDFKVLVETPWLRKEPIYIASEFVEGQLNTKLDRMKFALERNLPYHSFIKEGYATTWPLLLRLYYGLQSGYRISTEQFHSMLKVSYWRALGLNIETIPLFKANSVEFTELSSGLMLHILNLMNYQQQLDYIYRLQRVPLGERSGLRIELDDTLVNICNITKEGIESLAALNKTPIWSDEETIERMHASGLQMLGALLKANIWPYHPFFFDNKFYLVIPSQTVIQTFAQVINPSRTVKYVRRLGAISYEMMANHSAKNERAGNLFAPGIGTETDISNYVVHKKITPLALSVEHDDYHHLYEATISRTIYEQINRIPDVLSPYIKTTPKVTSEMERSTEREKSYEFSEQDRFFELLQYIFAVNPDAEKDDFLVRKSSLLVLVDMVLNPQKWPYYSLDKNRIIELLLPHQVGAVVQINEVERAIHYYFVQVNSDLNLLALLLLCHFYLNDEKLCSTVLALVKQNNFALQLVWEKGEDEGLVPIFLCQNRKYSLDELAAMKSLERMKLVEKVPKTIYFLPEGITADDAVKQTILNNQGEIINSPKDFKPYQFAMPCAALTAGVRKKLGLDRLRIVNPESVQLDYLKRKVPEIIIEKDLTKDHAFLCTFPVKNRPAVESILNPEKWPKTKHSIVLIQALFRGHQVRSHFFRDVTERKICIRELKAKIITATEKELFANVSSLATQAQQELDILNQQERVVSGWSRKK